MSMHVNMYTYQQNVHMYYGRREQNQVYVNQSTNK